MTADTKKISNFPSRAELREMKRREVIRRASDRFGKYGYENVSLGEIAADLGVTKAALYNYAASKNDLLLQCYQVVLDDLIAAIKAETASQEGRAAPRLKRALMAYVLIMTRRDSQYLWTYTRPVLTEERGRIVQGQRDEIDAQIRALLLEGRQDGSLRADLDPKLASLVVLGAVNWLGIWYRPDGPLGAEALAEQVVREALRGYLA